METKHLVILGGVIASMISAQLALMESFQQLFPDRADQWGIPVLLCDLRKALKSLEEVRVLLAARSHESMKGGEARGKRDRFTRCADQN